MANLNDFVSGTSTQWMKTVRKHKRYRRYYKLRNRIILWWLDIKDKF